MESDRLFILKALSAHLQTIRKDNGYLTDINKIVRGQSKYSGSGDLPVICLVDAPAQGDRDQAGDGPDYKEDWELLAIGYVKGDVKNPGDAAYNFAADTRRALAQLQDKAHDNYLLGLETHISKIKHGPGIVRPPDEATEYSFFLINLTLSVVGDEENPYIETGAN